MSQQPAWRPLPRRDHGDVRLIIEMVRHWMGEVSTGCGQILPGLCVNLLERFTLREEAPLSSPLSSLCLPVCLA
jgi:hypothetical protein